MRRMTRWRSSGAGLFVMLETWEAAIKFRGGRREKDEMIDIARLFIFIGAARKIRLKGSGGGAGVGAAVLDIFR
jgi:hypothetical protein